MGLLLVVVVLLGCLVMVVVVVMMVVVMVVVVVMVSFVGAPDIVYAVGTVAILSRMRHGDVVRRVVAARDGRIVRGHGVKNV